ncbi:hypothetical protein BDZ91DRAFT_81519 [Kalaharituber pfeilii]|nr:hypothetical protein BDZ91DRAFT_81519 [Kalaharituber pfeilii]
MCLATLAVGTILSYSVYSRCVSTGVSLICIFSLPLFLTGVEFRSVSHSCIFITHRLSRGFLVLYTPAVSIRSVSHSCIFTHRLSGGILVLYPPAVFNRGFINPYLHTSIE